MLWESNSLRSWILLIIGFNIFWTFRIWSDFRDVSQQAEFNTSKYSLTWLFAYLLGVQLKLH